MLLLALSALIPVILLGGVVAQYFIQQQRDTLDRVVEERASTLSLAISRELETQINLLMILAESPRLDPPPALQEFGEIARRLQLRILTWDLVRVSAPDGTILASIPPRGNAVGRKVVDISSHQQLIHTGKPTIGSMVRGPNGNYAFPIRVPVFRQGQIVSALSIVVRPTAIADILTANGLPGSWIAWVSDAEGVVVADTAASATGQPASKFVVPVGTDAGRTGRTATGTDIHIANAAIAGSSWTVHVGMPLSEYAVLSRRAFLLIGATAVGTLMLSGAAIYLFQKELTVRRQQEAALENSQRLQALGKLTGQVAHDFNNLLMIFQAGTNAIRRRSGTEDERLKQIFDSMIDGVSRGKEMTLRLLSFSRRSDQGSQIIDVVRALRDLDALLRQAANDSIVIDYDIDPRLWPVMADPKALEIALINLVTNAREAMVSGGKVSIRASNREDVSRDVSQMQGPFVAISVSDTGAGLGSADARRAFEPFFSTKGPGAAGLGLTQVLSFAERSGGTAKISSVQGVGTAVTLYLPRSQAPAQDMPMPPAGYGLPSRILIVDDTPSSLNAARLSFEGEPVEVLTAANGLQALDLLNQRSDIDALLSDIMMPGMSGIELAQAVRRERPRMKIVLMTGFSDQLEQGLKIDFTVLVKPFTQAELMAALTDSPQAGQEAG